MAAPFLPLPHTHTQPIHLPFVPSRHCSPKYVLPLCYIEPVYSYIYSMYVYKYTVCLLRRMRQALRHWVVCSTKRHHKLWLHT